MAKYRKKPVVIDAFQEGTEAPDWFLELRHVRWKYDDEGRLVTLTLEGPLRVSSGDWIIRGVKGELYPCNPDIFEATYEAVEEEERCPTSSQRRME